MSNGFALGAASTAKLQHVHPQLVKIVVAALALSPQDFSVVEGARTLDQEVQAIARGVSKLKDPRNGKHIIQADGFARAVDLVPFANGQVTWDWPLIYPVARAMQKAASQLNTPLKWGGVWDKVMADYGDPEAEVAAYTARCRTRGVKNVLLDGPHYELA